MEAGVTDAASSPNGLLPSIADIGFGTDYTQQIVACGAKKGLHLQATLDFRFNCPKDMTVNEKKMVQRVGFDFC